jgi:hypothetical protein
MTSGWQMPQAPHAAFSSPAQPSQIAGFHPANPGKSAPSGPARLKTTRKPLATPLRAVLANSIPLPRLTPASPIEFSFFVQVPPKTWVLSTAKPRFLQNSTLGNAFDRKSTHGAPSISANLHWCDLDGTRSPFGYLSRRAPFKCRVKQTPAEATRQERAPPRPVGGAQSIAPA